MMCGKHNGCDSKKIGVRFMIMVQFTGGATGYVTLGCPFTSGVVLKITQTKMKSSYDQTDHR